MIARKKARKSPPQKPSKRAPARAKSTTKKVLSKRRPAAGARTHAASARNDGSPARGRKTAPKIARPRSAASKPAASRPSIEPKTLRAALLELVRRTSAELPADVVRAIEAGRAQEPDGSNALWAMQAIEENIELAKAKSAPLCQDTGSILFYVHAPSSLDESAFRREAEAAVATATAKGYLRQNSVDSLSGRNTGNNLGPGSPVIHFERWNKPSADVRLILKGGGCENVGAQYSLPDTRLGANRDLPGVERCLLDAVHQAQGKGCGPGVLGVAIGGDRATGYAHSKKQLLRTLQDANPIGELAALEDRVMEKANQLGIGPMGFGGKTTLLGCKVGALNRLPASYFVSVSYMCWAYRRQGMELASDGAIRKWLY